MGETEEELFSIVETLCPLLPEDRPRYLMGVGKTEQLRKAIALGIDMFDCVLPMREARHGTLYLSNGDRIRILSSQFAHDHTPIDPQSPALTSRHHLRSYLHHLLRIQERLGETLACMQNLGVTLHEIRVLRGEIETSE
ncbi:tRNA-guanine transglycosylase [Candidatus Peregrinibacteria bacterium]|nr:tRNA-guanine transglycosylase [Candidatus Peregrinibacteria bacterium]MBI3816379.1 tRNA-guanine transglycosylase [Candidatus Peregrinibacteria bacterium]